MNILKEGVASFGLGCVSPIVLFHKIVGCAALATSPLLKSTNASAEKTAEAPMLSQGVYHQSQKIELNPNNKQATLFSQHAGYPRVAYNFALSSFKRGLDTDDWRSHIDIKREFNAVKREKFPYC